MTTKTLFTVESAAYGALLFTLLCSTSTVSAFNVTFEEALENLEWTSPLGHLFELTSGMEASAKKKWKYPAVDSTLRSQQGRFVVAAGTSASEDDDRKLLFSACLTPTGPQCTLHLDVWMSEGASRTGEVQFSKLIFCEMCGGGDTAKEVEEVPHVIVHNDNSSGRWVHHEVTMGAVHSLFVLAIVANVPDDSSIIAIDGIFLQNCGIELDKATCGEEEFQCPFTSQCIPRNKLCDLHPDCHCGQDELQCERIPDRGRATFQTCDLDNGRCYWYNAQSRDTGTLPWALTTTDDVIVDTVLPPFNTSGPFYAYVNPLSVQSRWTSQYLRSVDFPAVPQADGLCVVRFRYWISGDPELIVQLLELGESEPLTLWRWKGGPGEPQWRQAIVTINNHTLTNSYVLQMYVEAFPSYRKSAVAVTNITLATDCFGQDDVELTPCGGEGPEGPTPEMCDNEYRGRHNVTMATLPAADGVQMWTVLTSAKYNLHAYGARGGRGIEGADSPLAYGAHVQAKFRLTSGDRLVVVVGQTGEDSVQAYAMRSHDNTSSGVLTSGAGGGGATFVYRWTLSDSEPELLMMAGGGAGQDYVTFNDVNQTQQATGHVLWPRWASEADLQWTPLTNWTRFSGQGCPQPDCPLLTRGGFGAGLGACLHVGGHGGGVNMTYANSTAMTSGLPGEVYVHRDNMYSDFELQSHPGPGRLQVQMVSWRCPCDFLCLWKRPEQLHRVSVKAMQEKVFVCACPVGKILASDGLSCLGHKPTRDMPQRAGEDSVRRSRKPASSLAPGTAVLTSIVTVIVFVIVVSGFFIYVMRSGPQDRLWSLRLVLTRCLRNRSQSLLPLHSLPPSAMPARVMQINPNYSFMVSKVPEQKLPEIPRDNLRMSVQLGHGAFGEVYKGFLSGVSGTEREVAVAVKTLPPLCSEQTELDFFMEAFIVSKFHHPNIVQFLGVCFEQHPRYIVLELLEGGNLKSFLRENRPSQGNLSKLSVGDLITLARDVCCGCCYLELQHFIHRDIAARNCLLTSKGPERMTKIADFGMSRDVYRADYYKKEGRALLPLKWMPPEAFMEGIFTSKTDVWSFGVLLWEIFAMGYMPYPALSNTEVMNFIYIGGRLDCPEGCPSTVYDLMLSCWKQKSEERPTFDFMKQTLESFSQDSATMSQHLPAFRLPHLYSGCNGRNLKLLNHPVPDLGLDTSPSLNGLNFTSSSTLNISGGGSGGSYSSSSAGQTVSFGMSSSSSPSIVRPASPSSYISAASEPTCTEPLLKASNRDSVSSAPCKSFAGGVYSSSGLTTTTPSALPALDRDSKPRSAAATVEAFSPAFSAGLTVSAASAVADPHENSSDEAPGASSLEPLLPQGSCCSVRGGKASPPNPAPALAERQALLGERETSFTDQQSRGGGKGGRDVGMDFASTTASTTPTSPTPTVSKRWDPKSCSRGENSVLLEKDRKSASQKVQLSPLDYRLDLLVSMTSLGPLEENDEIACEEGKDSV